MLLKCGVEEDSWESLGFARRSNQSSLKEISPEYSLKGQMLKLKLQYFGLPDATNWLIAKDPDAGKDWWQEDKGTTEDEMVGCHHWLNEHEFGGKVISINRLQNRAQYWLKVMHTMVKQHRTGNQKIYKPCSCLPAWSWDLTYWVSIAFSAKWGSRIGNLSHSISIVIEI